MNTVACIVEGHGEVTSVPILLRRLGQRFTPSEFVDIPTPIRVHRDRFLRRPEEFRRMILLAAQKCGEDGWILVTLDADDDCPVTLARDVHTRAVAIAIGRRVSVVIANREYEAWFIAAAHSLASYRNLAHAPVKPIDPDSPRNAKGWISNHVMGGNYGETVDQVKLTAAMDIDEALACSRSFRKLCNEWEKQVGEQT